MRKAEDVTGLVGWTPVVRLRRLTPPDSAAVWLKLESFNPGGSVKDRTALGMIEAAESAGLLGPGSTIVEPTSGNTGIALAMIASMRGYRLVLVMPENMSVERRRLLAAYGAELVLTGGEEGMAGAMRRAQELLEENPDWLMLNQFSNPANPAVHARTTAEEILSQLQGRIDAFVAGVGTGGTITGVGQRLKRRLAHVQVVAVEPTASAVLSGLSPGPHRIQGIGAGFVPAILDRKVIDRIIRVADEEAVAGARRLAREEGLLLGVSSGAAVHAALRVAAELGVGKNVVAIAPDTGERYLSAGLFGGD